MRSDMRRSSSRSSSSKAVGAEWEHEQHRLTQKLLRATMTRVSTPAKRHDVGMDTFMPASSVATTAMPMNETHAGTIAPQQSAAMAFAAPT